MRKKGGGAFPKQVSAVFFVFMALSACSLVLLLVSTRTFMLKMTETGLSLFSGVRSGVHSAAALVSQTALSWREQSNLRKEYEALLERAARLEQLERSAAEIAQENIRLREQLGFAQTLRYRQIPAQLIGRDSDNLFSALVINKGRRAGVQTNMAVIAWQNGAQALVGKVVQTGAFESLVMPLYDGSSFVSARFAVSRYEGIVEGQGSADIPLRIRFIPRRAKDEISRGDMVVTSGMGGIYPPGISIGRVGAVNYREYEISMEAELEPLLDFSRLEYMFVIEPAAAMPVDNPADYQETARDEPASAGAPPAGAGA